MDANHLVRGNSSWLCRSEGLLSPEEDSPVPDLCRAPRRDPPGECDRVLTRRDWRLSSDRVQRRTDAMPRRLPARMADPEMRGECCDERKRRLDCMGKVRHLIEYLAPSVTPRLLRVIRLRQTATAVARLLLNPAVQVTREIVTTNSCITPTPFLAAQGLGM